MSLIKEQFRILSVAYPITTEIFEHIQSLRRKVYESQDYVKGIQAFLEKSKPNFESEKTHTSVLYVVERLQLGNKLW